MIRVYICPLHDCHFLEIETAEKRIKLQFFSVERQSWLVQGIDKGVYLNQGSITTSAAAAVSGGEEEEDLLR